MALRDVLLYLWRGSTADAERRDLYGLPPNGGYTFFPFGDAGAGFTISEGDALTCSAFIDCIDIISSIMSTLPIHVVQRLDESRRVDDHPLAELLAGDPNPYMGRATAIQTLMANVLFSGAGFAIIERDELFRPIAWYPIRGAQGRVRRTNGVLWLDTMTGGRLQSWTAAQYLHVPALSFDGITSLSPLTRATGAINLSRALETYAAKFFDNGGTAGDVIELPVNIRDEQIKTFKSLWMEEYGSAANAWRPRVVPAGGKLSSRGVTPDDAQALETAKQKRREIASILHVPLHLLGDLEKASYSNVEQFGIELQQITILPWAVKLEQELTRKLLPEADKPRLTVRVNLDGIARGDRASRYAGYQTAVGGPWMAINDARKLENMPPVAGGDVVRAPLNTEPIGSPAAADAGKP